MNRIHILLLTLVGAIVLSFSSCQKAPELTITSSPTVELNVDGSSGTITFTANRAWTISTSDSWVSVSPSSGEASKDPVSVSVRCGANTTYDDRTATVTIRVEDLTQSITIRQPANLGIILSTQSYQLASDAKTLEISVQANVQYTVSSSASWIKQAGTKGLTTDKLTFSIEENKTYDAREGTITIKSQNSSVHDQVISVKQAQKDALIIKDTSFDMPYGGGGVEIKVEANVEFEVKPDVDWIHYVETKALSNSTVYLTVDENATFSARTGKVEITQKNGTLKHTVTVNQAGRIAVQSITLDKTELVVYLKKTAQLTATISPDNATDKTITWTSSNQDVATVDESGLVSGVALGTAVITATSGDCSAKCRVEVQEDPKDKPISFADAGLKAKLVAKFDTNGDGEISYNEAEAVTSIAGVFSVNENFDSFDEFQYFTNVKVIPRECFYGWMITSIILPPNLEEIYNAAFMNCKLLKSIVIPAGIKTLGDDVFQGCVSLSSIELPEGLTYLSNYIFKGCSSIKSIKLPSSIESLYAGVFYDCTQLESIDLSSTKLRVIAYMAFRNCKNLESVILPSTMEEIHDFAFYLCGKLSSINIPEGVTLILHHAFAACENLKSLVLPTTLATIGENAFSNCSRLSSINIPESIVSIESATFYSCGALASIDIPASVKYIGNSAFYRTGLVSVTIRGKDAPVAGENAMSPNITVLYVPSESVEIYKTSDYWKDFADKIKPIEE